MKTKHKLYCNPDKTNFNFERKYDMKNLPSKIEKWGRVVVTFEKYQPMMSANQRGYYRGGILPWLEKELGKETGLNRDGFHKYFKSEFGKRVKILDKEVIESHADYTEADMVKFIDDVAKFVFEFFNITIPPPKYIDEYI